MMEGIEQSIKQAMSFHHKQANICMILFWVSVAKAISEIKLFSMLVKNKPKTDVSKG